MSSAFSSQQLAVIFGHDIFTSHNFKSPYQYWIPLISLYSGLRPSEVAQLHLEDIKHSGDIWYFDVNDTPPRRLMSRLRRVPIHSTLIDLGFLVFIDELKKADEKVLFYELWKHSELNPAIASKRFKILLEEVGVVDIGLNPGMQPQIQGGEGKSLIGALLRHIFLEYSATMAIGALVSPAT